MRFQIAAIGLLVSVTVSGHHGSRNPVKGRMEQRFKLRTAQINKNLALHWHIGDRPYDRRRHCSRQDCPSRCPAQAPPARRGPLQQHRYRPARIAAGARPARRLAPTCADLRRRTSTGDERRYWPCDAGALLPRHDTQQHAEPPTAGAAAAAFVFAAAAAAASSRSRAASSWARRSSACGGGGGGGSESCGMGPYPTA